MTEPTGPWGGNGQTAEDAFPPGYANQTPHGGHQQTPTGHGGFDAPQRGKGLRLLLLGAIVTGLVGTAFYVFDPSSDNSSSDKVKVGDCLREPDSLEGFRNAKKVACDDSATTVKVLAKVDKSSGDACAGVSSGTWNTMRLGIYRKADDAALCVMLPK